MQLPQGAALIRRAGKRLLRPAYRALLRDVEPDLRRAMMVAGTARSGTTWLGELIGSQVPCRMMFEPFNPRKVPEFRAFQYFQYMRPAENDAALVAYCRRVFSGAIRHPWIDRELDSLATRHRLIKEIRANLFLGWIRANFPEVPLLFIVRHPCAVVASRLQLGWATDDDLASFLAQPKLVEDLLGDKRALLEETRTPEGKHALIWCISNLLPLRQVARGMYPVVFFEHLHARPEVEIPRIFEIIAQPYKPSVFVSLRRPSTTSKRREAASFGAGLLGAWRTALGGERTRNVLTVVEAFGLGDFYGEAEMPRVGAADPSRWRSF